MAQTHFALNNKLGKAEAQMKQTADCMHAKRIDSRFIICDAENNNMWHLKPEPQTVEQFKLLHYVGGQGLN
jgi:hypothetical protein